MKLGTTEEKSINTFELIKDVADAVRVVEFPSADVNVEFPRDVAVSIWYAKLFTLSKIASDSLGKMHPIEQLTLATYVNSPIFHRSLKRDSLRIYNNILYTALLSLPPFQGEAFLGSVTADRRLFQMGATMTFPSFTSATTMWKLALDAVPLFNKKGIVFILKCNRETNGSSARLISNHSPFPDSEVIFLPGTKMKVKNWYHADVICLGQENIREHSFAVKEVDKERLPLSQLLNSDKSIIIELENIL